MSPRGWMLASALFVLGVGAAAAEDPPEEAEAVPSAAAAPAADGAESAERTETTDAAEPTGTEEAPSEAQTPPPSSTPQTRDLAMAEACKEALLGAGLRKGGVGVRLLRVSDGAVLCDVASDVPRLPASTTKVVTAAVALDRLGPDYRFVTTIVAAPGGALRGDRWVGDLWVVPSGDPTLDTARWRVLFDGLRRQGIAHIEGRVILAAGLHADPPWIPHWPTDDFRRNESYYATLGPFPTNGLRLSVTLRPGATVGQPAVVELTPPQDGFVEIQNRAVTSASAWTRRGVVRRTVSENGWLLEVSGYIGLEARPQDLGTWMVEQPDVSAAALVRSMLREVGVAVQEVVVSAERPPSGLTLSSTASEPLWTILQPMNKRSSNFLAEMVFRAIAVNANPEGWGAKAEDAARAVADHFARLGIPEAESWVVNGSGLTREHKLSPRALTSVVLEALNDPRYGDEFAASLSVAGRDGTLARRMTSVEDGQVRGKTGTLTGVVGLCGTFVGSDDEVYVFAALSNDGPSSGTVRGTMDTLVTRWIAGTRLPVALAEVPAAPSDTEAAEEDPP